MDLSTSEIVTYCFDKSPSPSLIFDRDTYKILKANEAALKIYGYSEEEFLGMHICKIVCEENIPHFEESLASSTGRLAETNFCHQKKNGNTFQVQIDASNFSSNSTNATLFVLHDISMQIEAQKRAQKAEHELEASQQKLVRAQEIAQVGSFEWDVLNDEIIYSNEAYNIYEIEFSDSKKPEIAQFLNVIHPDDQDFVNKQMQQILSGNGFEQFEHRLITENGNEKHVVQRGYIEYNGDNSVIKVFGTVQDITKQKKIQLELAKRSKAIEASMDGIGITDGNGQFIYMNNAHAAIFGYDSPTELLGKSWKELYPAEEIHSIRDNVFPEMGQKGDWNGEIVAKRKDGSLFFQELSLSIVEGGGFLCICRDITDRKQAEKHIEESLKEKEILLAEIHHRVKNNLAVVSGLLQMQVLTIDEPRLANYLQNSQLRIQSMAIVHEMLYQSETLSEINMDNYINELVPVIAKTLSPENKDINVEVRGNDFTLNINQAIPCALNINELVTNSFEYAFKDRKEGTIVITVIQEDGSISIEVQDNGIGLPENFEEMRKTSLGMSIIENLTRQLDADLDINSGKWGTAVNFSFKKTDNPGSSSSGRL